MILHYLIAIRIKTTCNLVFLEHDMHLLIEWPGANQLSLNMDKTVIMRYWPNTRPNSKSFGISVNGVKFQIVEYTKFLGIYIDQKLNWKKHCATVFNKLLANKHLLAMVQNLLDCMCLIKTCYAHIHSHLSYAFSVWGTMSNQKDIDNIQKLQKNCVRCIY